MAISSSSNNIKKQFSTSPTEGSVECSLTQLGLLESSSTHTLTANAGSESINLFQITGLVAIEKLWIVVQTDLAANLTGAYFDLYDGAAQVLTKNDGVISSLVAGSYILKSETAANTMQVHDVSATTFFLEDSTLKKVFKEIIIGQKTATNTYIRFTYTAAGVASGSIKAFCRWFCQSDTGRVTGV